MKDKKYPVYYRITPSVLDEWYFAETASWEDHHCPEEGHVRCVLERAKTALKILSYEEAVWLVHSAYFQGDTCGLDSTDRAILLRRRAIGRYGEKIAEDFGIPFKEGKWYRDEQAQQEVGSQVAQMFLGGRAKNKQKYMGKRFSCVSVRAFCAQCNQEHDFVHHYDNADDGRLHHVTPSHYAPAAQM